MKIKLSIALLAFFTCINVMGQITRGIDSLKQDLAKSQPDTSRVFILDYISFNYLNVNPDSAKAFDDKAIALAEKLKFLRGQARVYNTRAKLERNLGNLPQALYFVYKGMQIAEENNYQLEKAFCMYSLGEIYGDLNDYTKSKYFFYEVEKMLDTKQIEDEELRFNLYLNKSWIYRRSNQIDTVMINVKKAEEMLGKINSPTDLAYYYVEYGNAQFRKGNHQAAIESMHKAIAISEANNLPRRSSFSYCSLAEIFQRSGQPDSSIYYAQKGVAVAKSIDYKTGLLRAANILANVYDSIDPVKAIVYFKLAKQVNDEIYGTGKILELQKAVSNEQDRQRKTESEKIAFQNKVNLYALLSGILILAIIGFIFYRNSKEKHKANILLQAQKQEIQNTLAQLKSTQAQLIHAEKMASLGELTAGVAHEIQNPLNFVNNFADLTRELVDEMNEELEKGDVEEAKFIAVDIKGNLEKINHHGKRADSIVRNMLQHSRTNVGEKQETDINKLVDEYLRLSYHGLRSKDKSFNSEIVTSYDETVGKINIITQEIGRVVLNLVNNAFYAVNEKKKSPPSPEGMIYKPTVTVSTKRIYSPSGGGGIMISIADNGGGIPEKIKAKIFQPFFTTKPTGEGTGLGLSLCYDIIKMHGGEITVDSKEGEGTSFVFTIPQA